jgi:hypothetical protein
VVTVGLTDKLPSTATVPGAAVVYVELVYHFHVAPVPKTPPVCVKVVLLPLQMVTGLLSEVGAPDD